MAETRPQWHWYQRIGMYQRRSSTGVETMDAGEMELYVRRLEDATLVEALRELLPFSWHKHSCPKRFDLDAKVCNCGYDDLKQRVLASLTPGEPARE